MGHARLQKDSICKDIAQTAHTSDILKRPVMNTLFRSIKCKCINSLFDLLKRCSHLLLLIKKFTMGLMMKML